MKVLLCALLFSTTLFAGELSPRIFEVIGNYESETAATADSYMANELSSFNVLITPDSEAIIHFEDWDLELKLSKHLTFNEHDITECDDPGCSGVSEIDGEILFKQVDGKEIPYAKITMYFYADMSEEVDCDVVNCDDMDYSDYWREWEESYEYEFKGAFPGQLPAFRPATLNAEITANLEECKKVIKGTFIKCVNASNYKFEQEINAESLKKLNDYLGTSFKTELNKGDALQLLGTQLHNLLLQTKFYTFNGIETLEYKALETNLNKLIELVSKAEVDSILSSLSRSNGWRYNANIDFLLINKATLEVTRFKLEF